MAEFLILLSQRTNRNVYDRLNYMDDILAG